MQQIYTGIDYRTCTTVHQLLLKANSALCKNLLSLCLSVSLSQRHEKCRPIYSRGGRLLWVDDYRYLVLCAAQWPGILCTLVTLTQVNFTVRSKVNSGSGWGVGCCWWVPLGQALQLVLIRSVTTGGKCNGTAPGQSCWPWMQAGASCQGPSCASLWAAGWWHRVCVLHAYSACWHSCSTIVHHHHHSWVSV